MTTTDPTDRLTSPHDILSAYSRGEIGRSRAMSLLGLLYGVELIVAMADAGHPLPRPDPAEADRQAEEALPLLRAALAAARDRA